MSLIPDTVYGLPTHVLVLHAVVVLVPLGMLGAVAHVLVPPWRHILRWPALVVLTAGLAAVPVVTETGGRLRDELTGSGQLGGVAADAVARHADYGDRVLWPVLVTWLLFVAFLALTRAPRNARAGHTQRQRIFAILLAFAIVAGAGTSIVFVTLAGHSGSKAVWDPAG